MRHRGLALVLLGCVLAGPAHAEEPAPTRLTLALGGDVALPAGPNDAALELLGARVFEHVRPWLASADLAFANLEAPFTTRPATLRKAYPMTSPPARLAWIVAAGLDLFSLANNHMGDAGRAGVSDTLAALEATRTSTAAPLAWTGAGLDPRSLLDGVVVTPPGSSTRVALLALGNGSAPEVAHLPGDAAARRRVLARVRTLAADNDVLVVSLHGGSEYRHALDAPLAELARAIVDAGARIVVAHHPHVVRGIERRGDGLILHGVGNLAFATMTERHKDRGATLWGMLPLVDLVDGRLARLRVVPLWVDNAFPLELPGLAVVPAAALQPRPLTGAHARAALDFIAALSAELPGGVSFGFEGDLGVVDLSTPPLPPAARPP